MYRIVPFVCIELLILFGNMAMRHTKHTEGAISNRRNHNDIVDLFVSFYVKV